MSDVRFKPNILVVEDDEAHAELITFGFNESSFEADLVIAPNLKAARKSIAKNTPSLVIADLRLPDGSGMDLLTQPADDMLFPVVIMTGQGDEQTAVTAIRGGAMDYVVKSGRSLEDIPITAERAIRRWEQARENRRVWSMLRSVVDGTSSVSGNDFFERLVEKTAVSFGVDYAVVSVLSGDKNDKARTLSFWAKGKHGDNFEYSLAGTPCENVLKKESCFSRSGVQKMFPDDRRLSEMNIESFMGLPLFGSLGNVVGILAVLHTQPFSEMAFKTAEPMFEILASRAAMEVERVRAQEEILAVNQQLKAGNQQLNASNQQLSAMSSELRGLYAKQEAILASVPDIIMEVDANKVYIWANTAGMEFFGDDVVGKEAAFYFEGEQETYSRVQPLFNGDDQVIYLESWQRRRDGEKRLLAWWCRVLKDAEGNVKGALSAAHDITEHMNKDRQRKLVVDVLTILNRQNDINLLIGDILKLIKEQSGLEAVGLRLSEGDDFPFYETIGFSEDFLRTERYLCVHNEDGTVLCDEQGIPVLECMCGNIIRKRTDSSLPFFTPKGSFWSNCTTDLLASTAEEERQAHTRNRCNSEGYESVALIPLRSRNEIVGLLQLNDHRKGMFTLDMIEFFEDISAIVGIALFRRQAAENIRSLSLFPSENINPVLRIADDGTLLYANPAAVSQLPEWHLEKGRPAPGVLSDAVGRSRNNEQKNEIEIAYNDRVYLFSIAHIDGAGYSNLYGRDITARQLAMKLAQESEDKYRAIFENMAGASCLDEVIYENGKPVDYRILEVNSAFEQITGISRSQAVGALASELYGTGEAPFLDVYSKVAETGEPVSFEAYFAPLKKHLFVTVGCPGPGRFSTVFNDITDHKLAQEKIRKDESMFRGLVRILQCKSVATQEFLDNALNEAINLTESKIGYIYFYNEDSKQFILNSWSKAVMKECMVQNPQTCYELDKAGIWGEAVRQRRPIVINDFAVANPLKKGYPEGHVHLSRFMTVPVFAHDRIVAVVGVANKESNYDETDVLQLTLLMDAVWKQVNIQRAEEELRGSEARFRTAIERAPFPVLIYAEDGEIVCMSRAWSDITGYAKEDIPTIADWTERAYGVRKEIVCSDIDSLYDLTSRKADGEYRIRCKDGSERVWEFSSVGVGPHTDGRRLVSSMAFDVTGRHQTEEELNRKNAFLEAQANSTLEGILIVDGEGKKVFQNQRIIELWKIPQNIADNEDDSQQVKHVISKVVNPEQFVEKIIYLYSHPDETSYDEVELTDGTILERYSAPVLGKEDGQNYGRIWTFTDISVRKKSEKDLRDANLRLQQSIEELTLTQDKVIQHERLSALGQMASGIAHDFNNVLMPIVGFSELMKSDPTALDDRTEAMHMIDMICSAGNDARQIVRRLRSVYRKDDDAVYEAVDLARIIESATSLTMPKWKEEMSAKGIAIEIVTEFQSVPLIRGNAGELRELLINLIINAVDAMPKGGAVTFRLFGEKNVSVVLEVIDNGVGMDAETMRRCMEPFYTTKGAQGSGLGLAMVHGIIERHNGVMEIDSKQGVGTTMRMRFPVFMEHKNTEIEAGRTTKGMPPLRVLVIDDEERTRYIISRLLSADGHSLELASSGQEGLEMFRNGEFDLVITDRAMPKMGGDEVAAEIHKARPGTPVIMLTGFGDIMKDDDECPVGVSRVMAKPVTGKELRKVMGKVVGGGRQ